MMRRKFNRTFKHDHIIAISIKPMIMIAPSIGFGQRRAICFDVIIEHFLKSCEFCVIFQKFQNFKIVTIFILHDKTVLF